MKPWKKRVLIGLVVMAILGVVAVWYIFNEKFTDTTETKADFTASATSLIKEFEQDEANANKKYTEKILVVNGRVTAIEQADSTINIKMADTTSGSYIIFAFQQQHLAETKTIREGDSVSIKGSCSGGTYSNILETEYITFKRCALNTSH